MELRVAKDSPDIIYEYFKKSPETTYRSISLKRSHFGVLDNSVTRLNKTPSKISLVKHIDLVSLCEGPTAAVKNPEHVSFYKNLEYEKK
ncbi:unnamed protein product [Acanthoscelides obtectus]|uniref:Uncharacterized protein n=1 Tax=Acanthoscelides obtectus TaxID=200917 RepID=A0A9P0P722_ACAOB|nr:unnamed protein product [Acanthoscelides obtectus]CAK1680243.1 hypothetical protein AOBTE_LOCUS32544 [Acanthoscelides obtectus]